VRRRQPLYARFAAGLLEAISSGRLRPGDKLPTEDDFIKLHRVSRVTVRQALSLLRDRGLIERYARRGSFVASRPTGWTASSMADVLGIASDTVPNALEWTLVRAAEAAERLSLPPAEPLYRLRVVRSHLHKPVFFLEAYVSRAIGERLNPEDLRGALLVELIDKHLGIPATTGLEEISADVASPALARRLRIPAGSPVLVLDVTFFGPDGQAIEYARARYRADQVKRRNHLTRSQVVAAPATGKRGKLGAPLA
jgi:GntR family transcriptional regulator